MELIDHDVSRPFSALAARYDRNFKLIQNQGDYTAIIIVEPLANLRVQFFLLQDASTNEFTVDNVLVRFNNAVNLKADSLCRFILEAVKQELNSSRLSSAVPSAEDASFDSNFDQSKPTQSEFIQSNCTCAHKTAKIETVLLSLLRNAEQWIKTHQDAPDVFESDSLERSSELADSTVSKKQKQMKMSGSTTPSGSQPIDVENLPTKGKRMRPAQDIIHRIQWDPQLPSSAFQVGYIDRLTGLVEKPFDEFCWDDYTTVDDPNVLAVPRHRIQYFKCGSRKVWDRAERIDLVFGSAGQTSQISESIFDIVKQADVNQQIVNE